MYAATDTYVSYATLIWMQEIESNISLFQVSLKVYYEIQKLKNDPSLIEKLTQIVWIYMWNGIILM